MPMKKKGGMAKKEGSPKGEARVLISSLESSETRSIFSFYFLLIL